MLGERSESWSANTLGLTVRIVLRERLTKAICPSVAILPRLGSMLDEEEGGVVEVGKVEEKRFNGLWSS